MKVRTNLSVTVPAITIMSALLLHGATHGASGQSNADAWPDLIASMHKMHMAMNAIERSGDADVDFVRLMLPHHQGAIDMAKVQLLYGKDPQMRRLAQEIITDQHSEIELMQRWLKAHESAQSKENDKSVTGGGKNK